MAISSPHRSGGRLLFPSGGIDDTRSVEPAEADMDVSDDLPRLLSLPVLRLRLA